MKCPTDQYIILLVQLVAFKCMVEEETMVQIQTGID